MSKEQRLNKNKIEERANSILTDVVDFIKELLNIRTDAHEEGTIQTIKDSISMKGHTAWILIFSIFMASIGLNANSTAVVIGAMLISPLMGPILGVGLSIGINDIVMLRRSASNLALMVVLSLLTSYLFFSIPLFQDSTSELVARTRPDIRDVLIALAGGLALIIAISRPSPQSNTVAGVAIATALMPPLCTAGYGLASANYIYFFGALFLFFINCIFIALATFGIVKYLGFSEVEYIDAARKKRISRIASVLTFVFVAGSIYSFYNLIIEKQFHQKAEHFITELKDEGVVILGTLEENINYTEQRITLPLLGKVVSSDEVLLWKDRLDAIGLTEVDLRIQQEDDSDVRQQLHNLEELYTYNHKLIVDRDETIKEKDDRIRLLESELNSFYSQSIDFTEISREIKIHYPEIEKLSFYEQFKTDFNQLDTLTIFEIQWSEKLSTKDKQQQQSQLDEWLRYKMQLDTLLIQ